jgi:hypothetical protein
MTNLALLIFAVLVGWLGFFVLAPRMLISMSRYKLWELRDQAIDKRIAGELPRADATMFLIARIEATIVHIDQLTLWRLLFVPQPPKELRESMSSAVKRQLQELTDDQRSMVCQFHQRFDSMFAVHLLTTSPTGWLIGFVAFVIVVPFVIARHGINSIIDRATDWIEARVTNTTKPRMNVALNRLSEDRRPVEVAV